MAVNYLVLLKLLFCNHFLSKSSHKTSEHGRGGFETGKTNYSCTFVACVRLFHSFLSSCLVQQYLKKWSTLSVLYWLMGTLTNAFSSGSFSLFLISLLLRQCFWPRLICPTSLVPEFYVMVCHCLGPSVYLFSLSTLHLSLSLGLFLVL